MRLGRTRKRKIIYSVTRVSSGDMRKDCPELNGGASANKATHGDDSDNSTGVLVVSDRRSTKSEAWMLDPACSFHATPNKGVVLFVQVS